MDRRQKVLAQIDLGGRGLEIGPSYNALIPKSSGARIETVDHAGRAELVEKYRDQSVTPEQIASIEEVDHVWTQGSLVDLVGDPGAFDYIVASHVIEHIVDVIGFLQDCETLLREGGRLALAIPDKRYCFDLLQSPTSVGDAVNGHLSGMPFHPAGSVLDHLANACQRGPGMTTWDSTTTAPVELLARDLSGCGEVFERARRQEEYVDTHRWRFTPTSFRLLLQDLRDLGYHHLAEVGGFDTDGCEFFITLARTDVAPPREDRLEMLLRIDQELRSAVEPLVPAAELRRAEEAAAAECERLNAALSASERAAAAESERLNAALSATEQAATSEAARLNAALSASEQTLSAREETLTGVLTSKSWRVTRPLRAIGLMLKR